MAIVYEGNDVNKGSGVTATGDKPASTAAGDLMIAVIQFSASSVDKTISAPADWNLIKSEFIAGGANHRNPVAAYWRICESGDPASWTWTVASGGTILWIAAVSRISGTHQTTPINNSSIQDNASSTSCTAPGFNTSVNNCLLLFWGAVAVGRTFTEPSGMAERWEERNNPSLDIAQEGASVAFLAAGATGDKVGTISSAAANVGCLIAIAPPAAGGVTARIIGGGVRTSIIGA